jgi:hypothetical protein
MGGFPCRKRQNNTKNDGKGMQCTIMTADLLVAYIGQQRSCDFFFSYVLFGTVALKIL